MLLLQYRMTRILSVALCGFFVINPTLAQNSSPYVPVTAPANLEGVKVEEAERQRRVLFQRMLQQPDDLDAAFAYATLSVRIGDLEGAIATLERMLIYAPGLPRLQLELGLLYYRLNAHLTAQGYLEAAIAGDAPDEVRVRVEAILVRIAAAQDRDVFRAQVRTGIRFQTNANRAPEVQDVFLNGRRFTLGANSTEDSDFNAFVSGNAHFSKDLDGQGDTFDVDIIGYGSQQFNRTELDLATAEITVGPSFDLGRFDIDDAKLGIFGIASAVILDDDVYAHALGVGSRYVAQVRPDIGVAFKAEYRRRTYHNTAAAPVASLRDGNEYRLGGLVNRILSPNQLVTLGANYQYTSAERDYFAYSEVSVFANYRHAFDSPIAVLERDWIVNLGGGLTFRDYQDPDPLVSLTEDRSDDEFFLRAGLEIPFNQPDWAFGVDTEYRNVSSNYDLSDHDNFAVSVYVSKRW